MLILQVLCIDVLPSYIFTIHKSELYVHTYISSLYIFRRKTSVVWIRHKLCLISLAVLITSSSFIKLIMGSTGSEEKTIRTYSLHGHSEENIIIIIINDISYNNNNSN